MAMASVQVRMELMVESQSCFVKARAQIYSLQCNNGDTQGILKNLDKLFSIFSAISKNVLTPQGLDSSKLDSSVKLMVEMQSSFAKVRDQIYSFECQEEEQQRILRTIDELFSYMSTFSEIIFVPEDLGSSTVSSTTKDGNFKLEQTAHHSEDAHPSEETSKKHVVHEDWIQRINALETKMAKFEKLQTDSINSSQLLNERVLFLNEQWTEYKNKLVAGVEQKMTKISEELKQVHASIKRFENSEKLNDERHKILTCKIDELTQWQSEVNQLNLTVMKKEEVSKLIADLEQTMTKMQCGFAVLENNVSCFDKQKNDFHAFLAQRRLSKDKIRPRERVLFLDVLINMGGHYKVDNSEFVSGKEGLYLFSVSVNTNSEGIFAAAIKHNGNDVSLFGTSGTKDTQSSTTALVYMLMGDKVWVEALLHTPDGGVELGCGFSNFMGCFLY